MLLLEWLNNIMKKHDPDREKTSKEIEHIRIRHMIAEKRLDDLALIEKARRESLLLQAEVVSRRQLKRG